MVHSGCRCKEQPACSLSERGRCARRRPGPCRGPWLQVAVVGRGPRPCEHGPRPVCAAFPRRAFLPFSIPDPPALCQDLFDIFRASPRRRCRGGYHPPACPTFAHVRGRLLAAPTAILSPAGARPRAPRRPARPALPRVPLSSLFTFHFSLFTPPLLPLHFCLTSANGYAIILWRHAEVPKRPKGLPC